MRSFTTARRSDDDDDDDDVAHNHNDSRSFTLFHTQTHAIHQRIETTRLTIYCDVIGLELMRARPPKSLNRITIKGCNASVHRSAQKSGCGWLLFYKWARSPFFCVQFPFVYYSPPFSILWLFFFYFEISFIFTKLMFTLNGWFN